MGRTNLGMVTREANESKLKDDQHKQLIIVEDDDGEKDVIFNMKSYRTEEWRGEHTSVMARDHKGRKLLRWMIGKEFDEGAMEIISDQLDRYGSGHDG